jgi:hypothetical protein
MHMVGVTLGVLRTGENVTDPRGQEDITLQSWPVFRGNLPQHLQNKREKDLIPLSITVGSSSMQLSAQHGRVHCPARSHKGVVTIRQRTMARPAVIAPEAPVQTVVGSEAESQPSVHVNGIMMQGELTAGV